METPSPRDERELFAAAAALDGDERAAYLDAACADQPALRAAAERWLRTHDDSGFMEAAGHEIAAPQFEKTGERIGRCRLLEPIGEGGFGVVWLAEQEQPVRRRVALKIIKLGMDTREVVARFEQERQALAMMEHPGIAKVFDAGATPSGRPFFVMEWVPGARITEHCDAARLPVAARLRLFIAVCRAVQHAHQKGIIHRDLKPSNILVTQQDGAAVPKVIDFGVAKATQQQRLTELTLCTQHEQMIGTPLYMSPEQAEPGGAHIDTRSDIYALGVLLYELLAGRTPFDPERLARAGLEEIRRTIREREPLAPSLCIAAIEEEKCRRIAHDRQLDAAKLARRLRGDLDWIVMKALEKEPARRYETANGLALDLQRHLDGEPVLARPASALYRGRRLVRRHRLMFAAGTMVATALLVGLGVSIFAFWKEQGQRRIAETERQHAEEQRGLAHDRELDARRRRYASDMNLAHQAVLAKQFGRGRRLLDAHRPAPGESDLRGWEWRWLWQQLRGEARATLSRQTARAAAVSFSPDGQHVAVGNSNGRVEICDSPSRVLQSEGPSAAVAFSPVNDAVFFAAHGGFVKRYDFAAASESVLCKAPAEIHRLVFSRDGKFLALLTGADRMEGEEGQGAMEQNSDAPQTAFVVDAHDGKILSTLAVPPGAGEFFNDVRLSPDGARLYLACGAFNDPRLRCIGLADGQVIWEAPAPAPDGGRKVTGFSALDISPDGTLLATATGYGQRAIQIWNAVSGKLLRTLLGHADYVEHLAFSADGRTLASSSADETVRLWDTQTWGEAAAPLCGNGDEVEAVAFSPDGQRLATGSKDGLVLLWEPGARAVATDRQPLPSATMFAFLVPGGRSAFALAEDFRRTLIDTRTLQAQLVPITIATRGLFGGPNLIGFPETPRGFQLYEITAKGAKSLAELPLGPVAEECFAYAPETRRLAWAAPDSPIIHVTSIAHPGEQIDLTADGEICSPACFDESGKFLLATGKDDGARVWNVSSRARMPAAEAYLSPFGMTVFGHLPNALGTTAIRTWVTAAVRPRIKAQSWSRADAAPSGFWPAGTVTSRAYSPDGHTTALATENGDIVIFDAESQEKIATLHGRAHAVFALAFTPDGSRLLSANDAIWDVNTGQELLTLPAEGALHSVAQFGDDGNALLVGSWHGPGEYQCWRAPSWEEIAEVERGGGGWRGAAEK